jgi:hypothetical protein
MRLLLLVLLVAACGTPALALEVGDCFDDPDEFDEVGAVPIVDCADPHANEVYALFDHGGPDDAYPGEDALQQAAAVGCLEEFEPFIGWEYPTSEIDFGAFWPSEATWDDGDREIVCFAYEVDFSKVEGSLAGVGR